ncbi:timm16 [Symbiodinium natans]|uniref:Timm16 protein n=1 Tax=Symbiodinium natans TaxID=878477 RepID=A0A812JXL6_9DINO|nr:timm16 [Symbiodinium natans]
MHDGRLDPCEWCEETNWRIEGKGDHASYRCKTKNCRCSKSALTHDADLFNGKLALRSLVGALWLFLSPINASPDQAGLILGVDHRTVRDLFGNFRKWLTPIIDRMNEELVMGGAGMDVELDEISFRSKGLDDKVLWLRYIAIVRRGSAKVFIHKLPDKLTASGQGGGGPLSIQELKDTIVNSAGASRIAVGSVCHTDSAKAYKKLDSEEPLPCLYNGALGGPSFAHLKLAHSNVRHKPPHPEFTRKFKLKIFDGRQWVEEIRVGGTQKLDGFFATFRREVGKRPINTTGPSPATAEAMETQLHERVRTFQFLHWFSFTDAFQVFAEMRKLERASVGSVTWASLASFGKGKAKPSTAPETKSAEEVPAVLVPPAEESPQPLSLSCDEEHEPVYSEGEDVQSELFDPEEEEELIFDNKGIRVLN